MSAAVTSEGIAAFVSGALRKQIDRERHAVKRIAREAHVTPRAIENWASGLNAPRSAELVRLAQTNDEIAGELIRLITEGRCARS